MGEEWDKRDGAFSGPKPGAHAYFHLTSRQLLRSQREPEKGRAGRLLELGEL